MKRLLEIMEKLRGPEGCPWDREQTHGSIRPQMIEECYELMEAIDEENDESMKEELGDVLLQAAFHTQLAKERGAFDFKDVEKEICEKLIRRHPHVFGSGKAKTAEEVLSKWHEIKKSEKAEKKSALSGVPKHLPALARAQEIQKKAARQDFDWKTAAPVLEKVREEIDELARDMKTDPQNTKKLEEEMGDLFFAMVNLARHLKLDAEQACRLATKKFIRRFEWMEEKLAQKNLPIEKLSPKELDDYWEKAKGAEE